MPILALLIMVSMGSCDIKGAIENHKAKRALKKQPAIVETIIHDTLFRDNPDGSRDTIPVFDTIHYEIPIYVN